LPPSFFIALHKITSFHTHISTGVKINQQILATSIDNFYNSWYVVCVVKNHHYIDHGKEEDYDKYGNA